MLSCPRVVKVFQSSSLASTFVKEFKFSRWLCFKFVHLRKDDYVHFSQGVTIVHQVFGQQLFI